MVSICPPQKKEDIKLPKRNEEIMEAIPLRQFLYVLNFRYSDNEDSTNTDIIRIYFEDGSSRKWFEFGVYDWGGNDFKLDIIKNVLSEKILNMYVHSFSYDYNEQTLFVYLQKDKEMED